LPETTKDNTVQAARVKPRGGDSKQHRRGMRPATIVLPFCRGSTRAANPLPRRVLFGSSDAAAGRLQTTS
jgi:hypothetical protein